MTATGRGPSVYDFLNQTEVWRPRPPRGEVRIADMDPAWRLNSARMLERQAKTLALKYHMAEGVWWAAELASPIGPSESAADAIEEDMDREAERRDADPVGWLKSTPLYRALVKGLPKDKAERAELASRAKHFSLCPARTGDVVCECERLAAEHAAQSIAPPAQDGAA